ncbi:LANO_0H19152g1_1 [Lachancea nothofagi CBS 11611]|uniref:Probable 26S proteasome regulatory subunit p27 n=1 Tax=Lachancea nothofagi CBS 11611 TaxID=1266666 RepID=A0A1G4KN37_9SACH|nr:LANO_0H19152g1_1 [Lachancea nothofagi CBS 11611]
MQQENRFDILSGGVEDPNVNGTLKDELIRLPELSITEVFDLKAKLETELDGLFDKLNLQGADLNSNLVTPEGFPRSDVDVLQVRLLRRSINMLRNDLRAVISRTQELMATQFKKMAAKTHKIQDDNVLDYRIPFALVTEVVPGSPSHRAGLLEGDKIVKFGSINAGNNQSLAAIGPVVKKSENAQISIRMLRNGSLQNLTLTPSRNWAGPGLLGCRLVHV